MQFLLLVIGIGGAPAIVTRKQLCPKHKKSTLKRGIYCLRSISLFFLKAKGKRKKGKGKGKRK